MPLPTPTVLALVIGPEAGGPLRTVDEVVAVAGRGLEGDRKFRRPGRPARKDGPDREVTLIEAEALEAAAREYGVGLEPDEARRNVVTRGVALNHLVGREFRVGGSVLRGIRLCEPCGHLEELTGKKARKALVHRGGLRAEVLEGGIIRVGDPVDPL